MSSEPQAGEQADNVDLAGIGRDGTLEVTVDSPLKENDGTKDAYVSYLVTTHVSCTNLLPSLSSDLFDRQTSSPSRSPNSPSEDASPISFSFARPYIETTKHVRYLPCPRRTTWHT